MAGGASTPELAVAVCEAGGLGFVAAGYKTADGMWAEVSAVREHTGRPFGVNVFSPAAGPAEPAVVDTYAARLRGEAERAGAELGAPRHDDDGYGEKLERLLGAPPAVVSFTFGCPGAADVDALHEAGAEAWVTVTEPDEAEQAAAVGADALVVQGAEAGGHRGSFVDRPDRTDYGLLALLQLVRGRTELPMVATGGIATGAGVAAVLAAGAAAAQVGSAFMLCPEAGTSAAHREALATARRPASPAPSPAASPAGSSTACRRSTAPTRRSPIRRSTTSPRRCVRRPARRATARPSTCGPGRRMSWARPGRRVRSWRRWLGMRVWRWSARGGASEPAPRPLLGFGRRRRRTAAAPALGFGAAPPTNGGRAHSWLRGGGADERRARPLLASVGGADERRQVREWGVPAGMVNVGRGRLSGGDPDVEHLFHGERRDRLVVAARSRR